MIREFHIQRAPAARRSASVRPRRGRLSCVWIETGNSRQPLAAVWIDDAMRAFSDLHDGVDCEPSALCA